VRLSQVSVIAVAAAIGLSGVNVKRTPDYPLLI
jgi:hypothetical protein